MVHGSEEGKYHETKHADENSQAVVPTWVGAKRAVRRLVKREQVGVIQMRQDQDKRHNQPAGSHSYAPHLQGPTPPDHPQETKPGPDTGPASLLSYDSETVR